MNSSVGPLHPAFPLRDMRLRKRGGITWSDPRFACNGILTMIQAATWFCVAQFNWDYVARC